MRRAILTQTNAKKGLIEKKTRHIKECKNVTFVTFYNICNE